MGIRSTVDRTRKQALAEILANILNTSDEELADAWQSVVGKQYENCVILPEPEEITDDVDDTIHLNNYCVKG